MYLLILLFCGLICSKKRDKVYVIKVPLKGELLKTEEEKDLMRFFKMITSPDTDCYKLFIIGDSMDSWYKPISPDTSSSGSGCGCSGTKEQYELDGVLLKDIFRSILANDVFIRIVNPSNYDNEGFYAYRSRKEFDGMCDYTIITRDRVQGSNYLVEEIQKYDPFVNSYYDTMKFGYLYSRLSATFGHGLTGRKTISDAANFPTCSYTPAFKSEAVNLAILLTSVNGNEFLGNLPIAVDIYESGKWPDFAHMNINDLSYRYYEYDSRIKRLSEKVLPLYELAEKKFKVEHCGRYSYHSRNDFSCADSHLHLLNLGLVGLGEMRPLDYFLSKLNVRENLYKDLILVGYSSDEIPQSFISTIHANERKKVVANVGSFSEYGTFGRIHLDQHRNASRVDICLFTTDGDCFVLESEDIVTRPPSSDRKNVPDEWTCSPEMYGDGEICDCGCGAYDIDCFDESLPTNCYNRLSPLLPTTCETKSGFFSCEYKKKESVPMGWTCDPEMYMNDEHICHCDCGVFDPICIVSEKVKGCPHDRETENVICYKDDETESSKCLTVPKNIVKVDPSEVPDDWSCPVNWFGSNDGCDRSCSPFDGIMKDPDCPEEECYGRDCYDNCVNFPFFMSLCFSDLFLYVIVTIIIIMVVGICVCVKVKRCCNKQHKHKEEEKEDNEDLVATPLIAQKTSENLKEEV